MDSPSTALAFTMGWFGDQDALVSMIAIDGMSH
jgi:hypothetical protein